MNAPNLPLIEAIANELAAYRDDEEAFWDSLDGATDAVDLLKTFLAGMQDDEALIVAIDAQISALAKRQHRLVQRASAKRRVLGQILHATGMKKVELPGGTVSVRPGNLSVRIVSEDDVPSQLMREKITRAPDKAAIKAQIEAGETVPGCELVRGDDVVMVRVI